MNNDQIKSLLLELQPDVPEFAVILSGKASRRVNGLYKSDTREIIPFPDCPSFAEEYWKLTLKADTRSSYEWYLEILPNCPFAAQARAKIEALKNR